MFAPLFRQLRRWRRYLPAALFALSLLLVLTASGTIASDNELPASERPAAIAPTEAAEGDRRAPTAPAGAASAADTQASDADESESESESESEVDRFAATVAGLRAADFAAADEELPTLDWLELAPEVLDDWKISTVPDNPATLIVTPQWMVPRANSKSVLVLIPIQSSVYSTAISTNLSLFRQKDIPATFTIVNYGSIEDYGLALLEQAKRDRIDLILATGSRATDLTHKHFRGETIPVVGNTKDPVLLGQIADYEAGSGTNMAYTTFSVPFRTLQTYLLQLKPDLQNIAILYAEENTSAVETQVTPMVDLAQRLGIQSRRYGVKNRDNARAELVELIPQAVAELRETDPDLQNSIFFLTGSVSVYREIATLNQYAEQVPIVATLPDVVTAGNESATISIGGHFRNTSYITSLYAIRILRDEVEPGELPVGLVAPPDIAINFRRVQAVDTKVPFTFFEAASFVYDYAGQPVRTYGQNVASGDRPSREQASAS